MGHHLKGFTLCKRLTTLLVFGEGGTESYLLFSMEELQETLFAKNQHSSTT
jgi:hypothetical protein